MAMVSAAAGPVAEFERQVQTLIQKGYPALAGMTTDAFSNLLEPLRSRVAQVDLGPGAHAESRIPFVIVIPSALVPADVAMTLTHLKDQPGFADFRPEDLATFKPLEELAVPGSAAYLVCDLDTGTDTRNVTPNEALVAIRDQGRTPLTVDEGIALLLHYPEKLRKNHCFSLVGSRCGDRRVPALWISKGRPKLGWCWAGNPHTWLGSASCGGRVGG